MNFPFTVELQGPFSFRILWLAAGICLLLAALILGIVFRRLLFRRRSRQDTPKIRRPDGGDIPRIKQKYLADLLKLETEVREGGIHARETYQRLSLLIRSFVFEMTGIRVQEYTLQDIRRLRLPVLTELVQEYYVPEFADYDDHLPEPRQKEDQEDTPGNAGSSSRKISREYVLQSIYRTRKAIERWR